MRLKHIEKRISPYFEFGTHEDGFVDIASTDDDTLISHISKEDAMKIIKERDFIIDLLHKLSEKCGSDFDDVWYDNVL